MEFEIRRIILFTPKLEAMARFYAEVLGLALAGSEDGWREFRAGACNIALHRGTPSGSKTDGSTPCKIVFYAADVAATRDLLVSQGVKMGKVISPGTFDMCDGRDPDGNPFQISNRT